MKQSYKCSDCDLWYEANRIDHISYSTDKEGRLLVWIGCKRCQEKYRR